jgi:hypothetical protein
MKKDNIEETGGELTTVPNEKYKKFFDKFAEIETLDIANWKAAHLLGYFCKKYKEAYGVDYQWKFNHQSPAKCFEVWQFNTLCAKLSANPKILKEYMDWAFKTLVPKAKRRLTSISFLTREDVVIPYKMNVLLAGKKDLHVDRSTPLPAKYREIVNKWIFSTSGRTIETYGDLAFVSQMESPGDPFSFKNAQLELAAAGFDFDILKRIV